MTAVSDRPKDHFLLHINLMFLSQVFSYGLAFLLRVVLARGLGDDGLGTYSLFYLSVLIAGGLANLGLGLSNVYYLNRGAYRIEQLLAGSLTVVLGTGVLATLAMLAYAAVAGPQLFVPGPSYWLYAPAVTILVGYLVLVSFLHGRSRFLAMLVVATAQGLVAVVAAALLWAWGRLDIHGAVYAWVGSFLLADVLALLLVAPWRLSWRGAFSRLSLVLSDQVRYGLQGQVANIVQMFNYRLDQYLVAAFVSRAAVGQYVVAVGLAESVWWLAAAVAIVLQPRLTRMPRREAEALTPVVCRHTTLASALVALGLALAAPLLVPVVFGEQFSGSVRPLVLLLPGVLAASASRILGSYFFSQGKLIYHTYSITAAFVATLLLDLALIPWLAVDGAAIASSLAYTVGLLSALYWYRRLSSRPLRDLLVIGRGDLAFYSRLWRGLWEGGLLLWPNRSLNASARARTRK